MGQQRKIRKSMQIALCGLLGALMVVVMLLGSIVPMAAILCPALAGLFLIPAVRECGRGTALMLYIGVGALSLLLVPDKEVALLFALLLGPYPLMRPYLDRIPLRPLRTFVKLVICNALIVVIYALLLFILAPAVLTAEFSTYGVGTVLALMAMANLVFLLYDVCLARITFLYEYKLRDKLLRAARG